MSESTNQTQKSETAGREEEILRFWKENQIFEKSLAKESPEGEFVFYDGPPFATGLPHYGSLLSSVIKDVIPRYKTMRGYHVRRRWGWDCHGLPIENMIEKELGLKSKKEILDIGIEKFNEACRAAVMRYAHEWEEYVDRTGRWVEFKNAYMTMDNTFIESVWHFLSEMYKKDLLYEGRKVLLYCPHCETPLSKAEIAQDNSYKDVSEESVYVKFKLKNEQRKAELGLPDETYILAWTTTPWTLPGNVALAAGEEIDYVLVKLDGEHVVLAKDLVEKVVGECEIVQELKGKELIGLSYEPLFNIPKVTEQNKPNAHTVLPADFVTTDDGTGVVHTAVIYGEDDYQLGLEKDLPMVPLLNASGYFNEDAPELIRGKYFKKHKGAPVPDVEVAERFIKKDLEGREGGSLIFKKEEHKHSYPHCHRCDTPLIYSALTSWFLAISKVKEQLLKTNEDINWYPEHLKHGRYENILKNAPDWTISRNRFWASPMPIWRHPKTGALTVIGSLDELKKRTKKSGNRYFVMRHGESVSNTKGIVNCEIDESNTLTERGREQVEKAAEQLVSVGITQIVTSPLPRTRETAEIVARALGLSSDAVVVDERFRENTFGVFEGKKIEEYHAIYERYADKMHVTPEGGENWRSVLKRMTEGLYALERTHQNQTILVVSHNGPLQMIQAGAGAMSDAEAGEAIEDDRFDLKNAEARELDFTPLPHNADFVLDLHRPYIDDITILDDNGDELERVPEVIDGWVESGSMPFAEYHYPFENKEQFEKRFPGDFIAEYIAQTRTWFYYMHAVSVLMFGKPSFKNVVNTGNILAEDGAKMSKSKGNYTDPLLNFDMFGADAFRLYMMSGVIMNAEDMRFSDQELREMHNRVLNILWNTFKFYDLHQKDLSGDVDPMKSGNVLDQWIVARLSELRTTMTTHLDQYDTVSATRPIREFVDDFSTWYVRRSRDRFKSNDETDKQAALATTKHVLLELSKLIAPVMPFMAESLYQGSGGEKESVHLEAWPESQGLDDRDQGAGVLDEMRAVREIVSKALEARMEAKVKIRQPLAKLSLRSTDHDLRSGYIEIIKDELNVKEVVVDQTQTAEVVLDTELTPELLAEGDLRELIRGVQNLRKQKGLVPDDRVTLLVATDETGKTLLENEVYRSELEHTAGVVAIEFAEIEGDTLKTATAPFTIALK